jgi:uncharacterized membrane protein
MTETTSNSRVEAFCDGVFAIALTLLVIDIKIPADAAINTTVDFWIVLKHILPSVFAFLLSFIIILITWVNHHNQLKLIVKSNAAFLYANGFMLLTVVIIPFPTSLLGEHLFTDHASPAVVLYNLVLVLQALSWIVLTNTAIKYQLSKNSKDISLIRRNKQYGYFAFVLYLILMILSFWFPLTVAYVTAFTWVFWLIVGIKMKTSFAN